MESKYYANRDVQKIKLILKILRVLHSSYV